MCSGSFHIHRENRQEGFDKVKSLWKGGMGFGEGREKLFSRKVFPPFPNASMLFALTQLQHRHAADEQHHAEPRAGLEPLAEQKPAANGRSEDTETAPHGVGHREIHVAHGSAGYRSR